MRDNECVRFLREHLPRMQLRWGGFRKVRGQVCKRIARRLDELGITGLAAYGEYLRSHPAEWETLDSLCRITISRFYRDRGVFDAIGSTVLPALAELALSRGERELRAWSAGCAGGEEAYTLEIIWRLCVGPSLPDAPQLFVTATEADDRLLARALRGIYPRSALKDLPCRVMSEAFDETAAGYRIREAFRRDVRFLRQDIRRGAPEEEFHLILCRNLAFTYFDEPLQREILGTIAGLLPPGGCLVIGAHESLPPGSSAGIDRWVPPAIFKKRSC